MHLLILAAQNPSQREVREGTHDRHLEAGTAGVKLAGSLSDFLQLSCRHPASPLEITKACSRGRLPL